MSGDRFPAHVHADVRWDRGGIGRFTANVVPRVLGAGRELGGHFRFGHPLATAEMAARFAPLGLRGGMLFTPGFAPPFGWEGRTVATVHDLNYLDPAIASPRRRWYFDHVVVAQLRRCRLVLTVSEYSAETIREVLWPGGPDVVVVGNGVEPMFLRDTGPPALTPGAPRLLFVGGDKANKNLAVALAAVELVGRRTPLELVVVGDVADSTRASAPSGVSFVGTVDEARLADLYAESVALLMPSIEEGFGLPALESLVGGTPVVYGDRSALPGLVGDLGWPIDPFDVDSVAAGIEAAIGSPIAIPAHRRRALADAHRWETVADRVVTAVRAAL